MNEPRWVLMESRVNEGGSGGGRHCEISRSPIVLFSLGRFFFMFGDSGWE